MKRILLARYRRPDNGTEQQVSEPNYRGPPSDHNYAESASNAPPTYFGTKTSEKQEASIEFHEFYESEQVVNEVTIQPEDGFDLKQPKNAYHKENLKIAKNKKRKRKRKNEYDFGPKRKKAPRKISLDSGNKPSAQVAEADHDSLNTIKSMYAISEAKRNQDILFNSLSVKEDENVNVTTVSFSSEKSVSEQVLVTKNISKQNTTEQTTKNESHLRKERPRFKQTTCCQYYKCKKGNTNDERTFRRRHGLWMKGDRVSQRLLVKNKKLPFHELPMECKFKIFDMLDPESKGIAAQVCHDWRTWIMDPDSWRDLNLDFLSSGLNAQNMTTKDAKRRYTARTRYDFLKARTASFASYISKVRPRMISLSFQFDIGNEQDNWYSSIESVLGDSDLRLLEVLDIDWQTTPAKPNCLETYCCIFNKARVLFKLHFTRLHVFHQMLNAITRRATHVHDVTMPFDWSPKAVLLVSRWKALQSAKFKSYLNVYEPRQSALDAFLRSHGQLKHLSLAVCVPLYTNTTLYSLSHPFLVSLDISESKGFFLNSVNLPKLLDLKLSTHPWQGALMIDNRQIPCVYTVLCQGVPNLGTINRYKLVAYWRDFIYDELEFVLKAVCICQKHSTQPNQQQ